MNKDISQTKSGCLKLRRNPGEFVEFRTQDGTLVRITVGGATRTVLTIQAPASVDIRRGEVPFRS